MSMDEKANFNFQSAVPMQQGADATFPLAHVDFVPLCTDMGGTFQDKKFERFDILMQRVNSWLAERPQIRVRTCESVEIKREHGSGGLIDMEPMQYVESSISNRFIRVLRLWISSSTPEEASRPPQRLAYFSFIPACTDAGGTFKSPTFENFGQTLQKLNQMLKDKPLPGRILNLETQDFKFKTWGGGVDPDETSWWESGDGGNYFINVLRLFYDITEPAYEEIGCMDFVPAVLEQPAFLKPGKFQRFHEVLGQARAWVSQQVGIRVTNVQSIDYKMKDAWGGGTLDTHRTLFYEFKYSHYIRIVRVCFVRNFLDPNYYANSIMPTLSYRTFTPMQVTKDPMFGFAKFEGITDTMRRVAAWLTTTGAKVCSVETITIRSSSGFYTGMRHGDPEETSTHNQGDRMEEMICSIRVFLDGDYQEPPLEVLPPMPVLVESDQGCCTIL